MMAGVRIFAQASLVARAIVSTHEIS